MPIKKKTVAKKSPAKKAPAKKVLSKKAAAQRKGPPRRTDDDDDDDAEGRDRGPRVGHVTEGWGGADEIGRSNEFIRNLDWKNDAAKAGDTLYFLLRFVETGPYANLRIHWLDRKGKRSFICVGDDCPLCNAGHNPKGEYRFNVAVFTEEDPVVRSMNAGYRLYTKVKAKAEAPLTKPLPKRQYLVTRSGRAWNEISYDLETISDDDIAESYPDVYVPTKDEVEALEPYTLDDVEKEYVSMEELEEMAVELAEGDA